MFTEAEKHAAAMLTLCTVLFGVGCGFVGLSNPDGSFAPGFLGGGGVMLCLSVLGFTITHFLRKIPPL